MVVAGLPRTCANTNSVLNVYLVFKIRFIKCQVSEKSMFRDYKVEKEAQLHIQTIDSNVS